MRDPRVLYKYRSLAGESSSFTKRIITDNRVYFAKPNQFNDPFENRVSRAFDAPQEVKLEWFARRFQREKGFPRDRAVEEARKTYEKIRAEGEKGRFEESWVKLEEEMKDSLGVFSLSAKNDDIVIWSHYADGHKGICVEFEGTNETEFFSAAQPVRYREALPTINLFSSSDEQKMEAMLLTKAKHWDYEEEWRIMHPYDDTRPGFGEKEFPGQLLSAIILGVLISHEDRERVFEWVGSRPTPVKLYQARKKLDAYALEIVRIE